MADDDPISAPVSVPSNVPIRVRVNGVDRQAQVEPRLLLVHFLRETLGLTGTHVGCDTSQCGACAVLLDGAAVKACTLLAAQADGTSIVTIEGLAAAAGADGRVTASGTAGAAGAAAPATGPAPAADSAALHPLQLAFWEAHGLQCGFCTPGMVIAAYDLLQHNPAPSDPEIRHALEGNFCRCTGYHNIVRAVRQAAHALAPSGHPPSVHAPSTPAPSTASPSTHAPSAQAGSALASASASAPAR